MSPSVPSDPRGIDQASLLAEVSWIRRLAGELVADRELAEDLVQETCVAALEGAPRERSKLRQWLAGVLRNILRQHARAQRRRVAREVVGARPEALEATDRLVERVALQRELVDAVLALDESYRTAVLLRFFEELPPRVIAARLGVPVATVHSRLARALAKLRVGLEHRRDPGEVWALLLAPPLRFEPFSTSLLPLVMKTKLSLAMASTALVAGALVWWNAESPERDVLIAAPSPAAIEPAGEAHAGASESAPAAAPRELLGRGPDASEAPPAFAAPWSVRLRVLDAEGQPLTGLAVRAEDVPAVLGTSVAGGWCLFETRAPSLRLVAADERWVTIHAGTPARGAGLDPVLVAAPTLELAGHVRDEAGRALVGASVRFLLPDGFHARFSEILEASVERRWRVAAESDGSFRFARAPAVRGARLTAVLAGYELGALDVPSRSDRNLELVLARPRTSPEGALRGTVVDLAGAPVEGARVALGLASVASDERGEFSLAFARALTSEELVAVKSGYLPARLERPGASDDERYGWPEHVIVVLPGPALALRGSVVDHEGRAVAGARVWLHDPTFTAPIGFLPTTLEALMGGAEVPAGALESIAYLPEKDGSNYSESRDRALAPDSFWNWTTTDGSGHFELPGLEPRRYRLDVLSPDSLDVFTSEPFEAGREGVRVRLPVPDLLAEVRGRVVTAEGEPVAGASLHVSRAMVDATARVFGGHSRFVRSEYGATATSDAEGAFVLRDVPRVGAVVAVRGESVVPCSFEVGGPTLELVVEQLCRLEVVLRDSSGYFERMQVVDGGGRMLELLQLTEGSTSAQGHAVFVDGRSGVFSVSARARWLRLFHGETYEDVALYLSPGEVNRLEL